MARHTATVMVHDPKHGTERAATLEIETGSDLVIEALTGSGLTDEILANAAYDAPGGQLVIKAIVKVKRKR